MASDILRKIVSTITVGDARVFFFLLLRLSPGDPAAVIAGDSATHR